MKTNTILKIIALCVICAVTLMSGCLESESPPHWRITYGDSGITYDDPAGPPTPEPESIVAPTSTTEPDPIATPELTPEIKSTIPDDYYDIVVDQYFIDYKMHNYLAHYTWGRPLLLGAGWGIPEVAELEHELTENGCNVIIRMADVKTTINHDEFDKRVKTDAYERSGCLPELDQYSYWLMIELDGEMVAYNVYRTYWAFKPESTMKDEYVKNGKWHDWWYYKEGTIDVYDGSTWTASNFRDFNSIYDVEEYFLSGNARSDSIERCENGMWCSYFRSEDYNATDHFLIEFGWWITEEERHETETRINEATEWFTLVDLD